MAVNFGVFYKFMENEVVMPVIKVARQSVIDPACKTIEEVFFKKPDDNIKQKSPSVDHYRF